MGLWFIVPAFLAGLAALAIPIWVHLRNRRKDETQPFPSLMFLERIPYRTVQQQQLRHLLLFAARCGVIALLALAFARPFLSGFAFAGSAPSGARELVILLDRSWSMGMGDRWQSALDAAGEVASSMSAGDLGTLVLFDSGAEVVASGADRSTMIDSLGRATLGHGRTSYLPALRAAETILGGSTLPRREVVLISDYQRAGWQAGEPIQLPPDALMRAVDVAAGEPDDAVNLSIASVTLRRQAGSSAADEATDSSADGGSAAEDQLEVTARITNQGSSAQNAVDVVLSGGGPLSVEQSRSVDIEANGSALVRFDPFPMGQMGTPGAFTGGTVGLAGDDLTADNELHFVVSPGQVLSVLVVEAVGANASDSLFVTQALGLGSQPAFRVVRRRVNAATVADLDRADIVLLNDAVPGAALASRLWTWVEAGGGLLIAAAELAEPAAWDAFFEDVAFEGSPFSIGETVDRSVATGGTLAGLDLDYPAFELFREPGSGDFSASRFFRYRALVPRPVHGVLARFDDGGVALAEARVGSGRLLVWTSSLDAFWNTLPQQPVYLPLVHELVKYTADYSEPAPWVDVGRPLAVRELVSAASTVPTAVSGSIPSAAAIRVTSELGGVGRQLSGADGVAATIVLDPGFHTVAWGEEGDPATQARVAANVDRAEGDLSTIDPEELVAAVTRGVGPDVATADSALSDEQVERSQGFWWYLLIALFALLATETALSNRLSSKAT